jgi:hypothetical protein
MIHIENKKRIFKAVRGKYQIAYKGKHFKITAFSIENIKARRAQNEIF